MLVRLYSQVVTPHHTTGKTEKYQIWSHQFLWWALPWWSCQGLSRDNVETGWTGTRLGDCDDVRWSSSHSHRSTGHTTPLTAGSLLSLSNLRCVECWVLSVECWDVDIGLITEPSLSWLVWCVWAPGSPPCQQPELPGGRQVPAQLGPDQRPEQEFHQNAKLNILYFW